MNNSRISFKNYLNECEEREYYYAINVLENLNEFSLTGLANGVKEKIEFFKSLAEISNSKLDEILQIVKDSRVFKFFKALSFNLSKLFDLVKTGYKHYEKIQKIVASYIANSKIGKFTEEKLKALDDFLQSHPYIKKIGGVAVAGILLYIWLNMSFTGNFSYDFDFSDLLSAVGGKYSISDLFGGVDGTRMLMLFATGMIGLSFPWPGATSIKFGIALLNGIKKLIRK